MPSAPPDDYRPASDLLAERVILVTGAGDGLGKTAALTLAAHGATVVLLGHKVKLLERVYDAIEEAGGPQPAIYPFNLEGAAAQDYEELAARIGQTLGRLDGLLHNAAQLGTLTPMRLYDPATWGRVMQVNVNAPYLLTRACLDLLMQADDASIVFSADRVGRQGRAYWGAYGVSKFAVEGMMQILADEHEGTSPVRVNSLDPGAVRTSGYLAAYPGIDPSSLPLPETVMPWYLWLLGPDSVSVTGQALTVPAADLPVVT
ncbi:MAG: YciK family oxidoreductase [Gammaproteobacteria bacterium]|nr:MAG: YciK family oxidoreductase [Gammaproteobacteria bacterium]